MYKKITNEYYDDLVDVKFYNERINKRNKDLEDVIVKLEALHNTEKKYYDEGVRCKITVVLTNSNSTFENYANLFIKFLRKCFDLKKCKLYHSFIFLDISDRNSKKFFLLLLK